MDFQGWNSDRDHVVAQRRDDHWGFAGRALRRGRGRVREKVGVLDGGQDGRPPAGVAGRRRLRRQCEAGRAQAGGQRESAVAVGGPVGQENRRHAPILNLVDNFRYPHRSDWVALRPAR
jgi:hypothetical protein